MGLGNYFRASKTGSPAASAPPSETPMTMTEKPAPPLFPPRRSINHSGRDSRYDSSRASIAPSMRSNKSSFLEDIKHEVMVNYLYQQQCSHLWVGDGSGESEGVLLRKGRNHYLACPPQLANSALAIACAELHVQVRLDAPW
jgi:hypothetical protein